MRVLICGNMEWPEYKPILSIMEGYQDVAPEELVFISGMAPGADAIAFYLAAAMGVKCDEWPASKDGANKALKLFGEDYDMRGRNQWMLDSGVDVCHAFAYDLRVSYGTRDMVNRCVDADVLTLWFDGKVTRRIWEPVEKHTDLDELEVVS